MVSSPQQHSSVVQSPELKSRGSISRFKLCSEIPLLRVDSDGPAALVVLRGHPLISIENQFVLPREDVTSTAQ